LGKLAHIVDKLEGKLEPAQIEDQRFDFLLKAILQTATSADQKALVGVIEQLSGLVSKLDFSVDFTPVNKAIAQIPVVDLSEISASIKSLERVFREIDKGVRKEIKSIPQTDISPLQRSSAELRQILVDMTPAVVEPVVIYPEDKARNFDFTFIRDGLDLIERIEVREVG